MNFLWLCICLCTRITAGEHLINACRFHYSCWFINQTKIGCRMRKPSPRRHAGAVQGAAALASRCKCGILSFTIILVQQCWWPSRFTKAFKTKQTPKVRKWESLYFSFGCRPLLFHWFIHLCALVFFTQFPRNLFNFYQFSHHGSDNSDKKPARQKCRLKMNFLKVERISPQIRAEKNKEANLGGKFP